jgi:hypothetical protein
MVVAAKYGAACGKQDVTREDVLAALAEFDGLGREVFLDKYGIANDPAIGYNLSPRWSSNRSINRTCDGP